MRRRPFAQVTAVAVLAGSLAFGQGAATAMHAAESTGQASGVDVAPRAAADAGAETPRVDAAPRAFGPFDVVKAVKGLYDAYKTCKANEAVDQPCTASDSDNIRAALDGLKALDKKVDGLQQTLDDRFKELDISLSRNKLDTYRRALVRIDENVPNAIRAFSALVDCQSAKLDGKGDCARFSLAGTGAITPVDDGINYNRQAFLSYTNSDRLPQDLTGTIADYAGSFRSGALSDLSFANVMWRFAKLKVEYEAGVSNGIFKKSTLTPIVTPSMSTEVNTYLQYYGDLLSSYSEVLYLRAIVMRDQAAEEGDDKGAKAFQNTADDLRDQIASRVDSADANSVAGVYATYRLTPLQNGDIIMASEDGIGARVFETGGRYAPAGRPMNDMDVAALGQGLRLYGKYSQLKEREPEAFPKGSDWYVVRAKTIQATCDARAFSPGSRGESDVTWLPSVVDSADAFSVMVQNIRVRLLDRPEALPPIESDIWPGPVMRCFDGSGERYGAFTYRYDPANSRKEADRAWAARELRYPMTYDWEVHSFKYGVDQRNVKYGKGVSVELARAPHDSIFIDMSANQLVRWPEGFTPTGMPPGY